MERQAIFSVPFSIFPILSRIRDSRDPSVYLYELQFPFFYGQFFMEIQRHKHSYNKGKDICNGLSIQDPIYS